MAKKISAFTKKIEGFDIELVVEEGLIKLYYDTDHNYLVDTFMRVDNLEIFLQDYIKTLKLKHPKDDIHDDHKKILLDKGWNVRQGVVEQLKNVKKEE